jgi:hypothetical protein
MSVPTSPDDFRAEAAAASLDALAARRILPAADDLTGGGMSLCVPAPVDSAGVRRAIAVRLILIIIFGVGGIAAGALAGYASEHGMIAKRPDGSTQPYVWGLMALSPIGMALMVSALRVQRRCVLRHLRSRGVEPPAWSQVAPLIVEIEDPQTAQKLKLVVDDVAELYQDPGRRRVALEGISYRYVIRGEDVIDCHERKVNGKARLVLTYRIAGGDGTLALLFAYNNASLELKRQTLGWKRAPLAQALEETLRIEIGQAQVA